MDEKQKQIEEMAKIIEEEQIRTANTTDGFQELMKKGVAYCHSKAFYNAGYRKIPEDAVVLTGRENQKYCAYKIIEPQIRGCLDRERELEKRLETIRKEMAREIANEIKLAFYREFDELIPSIMADKIDEIAKQYGVEVE